MHTELTAADGHTFAAYRAEPAGTPRGGIVVVQEIFGVNHHIRAVTDSFAHDGYLAIAPALWDRQERGVELGYDASGVAKGRQYKARANLDAAMLDVTAAIQAVAPAGKVGIVGFCWGGFVTWVAAARLDGLACAVPYYGGGILDHADLEPRCPVLGHFGERDAMIPAKGVRALAAQHPQHRFELYDADHGFHCDERGSFDGVAAKLARERTLAFFRTHVG
ncbi:MAG TPA: dienelactone hydrolase family protein [Kofleriaceae bacterium]|nr:dienelactone hydrolase family protein [Kofleriaceae bacterium]